MSLFLSRWARLYSKQTPSELALEPSVARLGVRYRSQHPEFRMGVVLDFALLDYGIAIEVDGPDHQQPKKREADRERTRKLSALGWTVVRCTNAEALTDPEKCLRSMLLPLGWQEVGTGAIAPPSSNPQTLRSEHQDAPRPSSQLPKTKKRSRRID